MSERSRSSPTAPATGSAAGPCPSPSHRPARPDAERADVIGFVGTCVAALAAGAPAAGSLAGILVHRVRDLRPVRRRARPGDRPASKFGAFLDSTLDRTGREPRLRGHRRRRVAGRRLHRRRRRGAAWRWRSHRSSPTPGPRPRSLGLTGDVGFAPRRSGSCSSRSAARDRSSAGWSSAASLAATAHGLRSRIALALGLIAVLSAITIVQRILHVTTDQLDQQEHRSSGAAVSNQRQERQERRDADQHLGGRRPPQATARSGSRSSASATARAASSRAATTTRTPRTTTSSPA